MKPTTAEKGKTFCFSMITTTSMILSLDGDTSPLFRPIVPFTTASLQMFEQCLVNYCKVNKALVINRGSVLQNFQPTDFIQGLLKKSNYILFHHAFTASYYVFREVTLVCKITYHAINAC